jgi:hypothetical protein
MTPARSTCDIGLLYWTRCLPRIRGVATTSQGRRGGAAHDTRSSTGGSRADLVPLLLVGVFMAYCRCGRRAGASRSRG